jgi:predicted extracellular nuclease
VSVLGRKVTGLAGAGVLAVGVLAAVPMAEAAPSPSAAVVINEVYGGGGNSGATLKQDFIELANVSGSPIDLTGWSVQYASSAGTTWQVTPLSGTVAAGAIYVVREAAGSGGTVDVVGNVTGSIPMSGTTGKVALVNASTALPGSTCTDACSDLSQVIDFVGYGTANDWAGSGPAPGTSNTTSDARNYQRVNTADNSADFTAGTPTPGADTPPPPGTPLPHSIAEVQGTGASSPLVNENVIITGVVTAAYPTGGFHGFYLQTQGTGGERDLTAASDGIFVFQSGSSTPLDADAVVGNYVQVTGKVSEFSGLTEVTASADAIVDAGDSYTPVTPITNPWPTTDPGRESIEGMLFQPTGDYTVTNTFATNQFGEVGLAVGTKPLIQNTEVARPRSAEADAVVADNAERFVTLDDGASTNFTSSSFSASVCGTRPVPCLLNGSLTPAYVSNSHPVRVGEPVTFTAPVVVDYRFNLWRFQPTAQVVGPDNAGSPVEFKNTRTAAPDAATIGSGDVRVASFNVLNFFTDLGDQNPDCEAFYDRDSSGNNVRTGCDQRGAWDAGDLGRQQEKIVSAINSLGADVVGLMEIENSAKFGHPRDETLAHLVDALNAKAGAGTWAYVPSSTELPAVDLQDFITNAIIYKPANIMRVDASRALGTASEEGQAFANAREPIAQVFKKKNAGSEKFLFVVNHFKSKGSAGPFPGDEDTGDGQGASVTSRILQAQALRDWIPSVLTETSTKAVVMAGDYNSYTMEDPLDVLYDAGYTDVGSRFDPGKYSYSFSGLSGSLDHILVNAPALAMATGADHWAINSGESVALEYSRYNYHSTDFHDPGPYRSSDHDPVVLGLQAGKK